MSGPGQASTQYAMQRRRETFFAQYPKARTVDIALKTGDNPSPLFFLSSNVEHSDLRNVGFAIGRLGPDIERQFLINGEIAFFFAPWRDFLRRSFNVMTQGLASFSKTAQLKSGRTERFTPSSKVVILVSEDLHAATKVEEWQQDNSSTTLVVPVPIHSDDPEAARIAILSQLRAGLGDRDLYRTQNPVMGEDFFGRHEMLRTVSAALKSDENVAILGLRRSGKTSVLRELKRRMLPQGVILTLGDFQVLQQENVGSLAKSIASHLVDDLRSARQHGLDVKIGDHKDQQVDGLTLPDLSDRLKRVGNRNPELRFIIAIDEIESAARIAKSNPEQVRTLLAALRTAAQACPNVSLAFSGVANRMFRSTVLGSHGNTVDNPMFGQVTSFYITAFGEVETRDLLQKLGRPMFIEWSSDAVTDVQAATGGVPYFVRNLASAVRAKVKSDPAGSDFSTYTVQSTDVTSILPKWQEDAGHDWQQLIEALRLHYTEAADLLEPSLSEHELNQWISAEAVTRDAADDLAKLGLLTRSKSGSWERSPSLQAIHGLIAGRPTSRLPVATDPHSQSQESRILNLIAKGECHNVEFKETFRINSHTGDKEANLESEVARAVAGLMNTDGGTVIVGVHDSGEIRGLARDLKLFKGSFDQFERWIMGSLLGRRIDSGQISRCVRVQWIDIHGATVCALDVQKSSEPSWLDDEHLHVRNGNQTLKLTGRQLRTFLVDFD